MGSGPSMAKAADNIDTIKAEINDLKQQSRSKQQQMVTKKAEQDYNNSEITRIQGQIDQKERQASIINNQLRTLDQNSSNLSNTVAQDIASLKNNRTDNVGGPIGVAKNSLNNVADGIFNVVTTLKNTGYSDADIDKVFKNIGVDPRSLANEIRGMADQIKPMNLDELKRWRDQLEKERAKAQKSKDDTEAKAAKERAEVIKIDGEIRQKEADKRFWETKRDENNREADRIGRTCGWWPWCLTGIGWHRVAAGTNQTLAWATEADINLRKGWRNFPQMVVSTNSALSSPYAISVNALTEQRDAINKTIFDIEDSVRQKESARQKAEEQRKKQQETLITERNVLRSDIDSLKQKQKDLSAKNIGENNLQTEKQNLDKKIVDLQKTLDNLIAIKTNCTNTIVPANQWRGAYYANMDLSQEISFVRAEGQNLNLQSGTVSPSTVCDVPAKFSVSWKKDQKFDNDTYRFVVTAKDAVRVYIDNEIKLDKWSSRGSKTFVVNVSLADGIHALRVEYAPINGNAAAGLTWSRLPKQETTTILNNLQPDSQTAPTCPIGSTYSYTFQQCMSETPSERSPYDGKPCPTGGIPDYAKIGCIPS